MTPELGITKYFLCPRCRKHRFTYSHLDLGQSFGPWACNTQGCNASIRGKITVSGDPEIEIKDQEHPKGLMLLKFRDLYLVVEGYSFFNGGENSHYDFLVHSHQCPTNLLRSVLEVFDVEQGRDPHGVLRFVAVIEDTQEHRELIEEGDIEIAGLFQVFKTDGTPPPTQWPERNYGMLPWIAEERRAYLQRKSPKA